MVRVAHDRNEEEKQGRKGKRKRRRKGKKKEEEKREKKKWVCDSVCVISKEENKHQL
jgi:hypothetical protein